MNSLPYFLRFLYTTLCIIVCWFILLLLSLLLLLLSLLLLIIIIIIYSFPDTLKFWCLISVTFKFNVLYKSIEKKLSKAYYKFFKNAEKDENHIEIKGNAKKSCSNSFKINVFGTCQEHVDD